MRSGRCAEGEAQWEVRSGRCAEGDAQREGALRAFVAVVEVGAAAFASTSTAS